MHVELESIYQTAPIGLGVLDHELRFVRANQRLAEMIGSSVEALIGKSVALYFDKPAALQKPAV